MALDFQKELTPVLYGDSAVKVLEEYRQTPDTLCFRLHWHDRMELLRVSSGTLELSLGERHVTVCQDELAVIAPCQPHRGISGSSGVAYRTLMFDVPMFYTDTYASRKYLKSVAELKTGFCPVVGGSDIIGVFDTLLEKQQSNNGYAALCVIGKVYELFALLYQKGFEEKERGTVSDDRFRNVLDYINAHFCEEISSAVLSRKFGYDEAYFCRRFKAVTGLSPMKYIKILRLELARNRIRQHDGSIGEIAAACGFDDLSYFSRSFKAHYDMTPTEYAAHNRRTSR